MSEMVVTALGCHSAVGLGVDQTCAAIRAGISRLRIHEGFLPLMPEFADAAPPEPVKYAPAPGLPERAGLDRRLTALAARAVVDLVPQSALTRAAFQTVHLLLALPENLREGIADVDAVRVADGLRKSTSLRFAAGPEAFPAGHAAGLLALDAAQRRIHQDAAARCLLVAVDSNVLEDNLNWLDASWRLKSQRNVDGFVPGEAGVAILLESAAAAARRGAPVLARVTGIGIDDEPKPLTGDSASTGTGLARAIDTARRDATQPIGWVICDLNGESYRAREWGLVVTRLASRFTSPVMWHPAENIGDLGAASGAMYVALACLAFARAYAPGDRALVWCASDSKTRAACVVQQANGGHSSS